jgi:formylglycine-generating enzyme required for sulfatase activity
MGDWPLEPWVDDAPVCVDVSSVACQGRTTIVGFYPGRAGPYGVLEMAGNAQESVADRYGSDATKSPERKLQSSDLGGYSLSRGGDDASAGKSVRRAALGKLIPSEQNRYHGFRVVVDPVA